MIRLIIALVFTSAQNLYVVLRNAVTGQVWNTSLNSGGGWENYASGHWANYAIALTEQAGSGFYSVAYPTGIAATDLSIETFYQRGGGSPVLGDAPATGLGNSQGQNLTAVAGDAGAASTFEESLSSMTVGAVAAGTLTANSFTTNLSETAVNAFSGLSIRFTKGASLVGEAALIVAYNPTGGLITIAGSLTAAPVAADGFIIC